jgi:methionyl-tRNA formyltransferase
MRLRVVFFGSPDFAVPTLEAVAAVHDVALVVAQPDRPAGRGRALQAPAVKARAQELGLPVAQPERLKSDDGQALLERLRVMAPDVFVVVAYGKILPQAFLDVPRLGPFNVHASLLPRYRGAAPIQWAVINGDARTGVAIMRMEAGMDTGPIVAVRETAIGADETSGELFQRLAPEGARLLVETLPMIVEGRAFFRPQDERWATTAPMLTKDDGRLDFSWPAARVAARARGVDPWPGAWTLLEGQPLKVFRPRAVVPGASGSPGEIVGLAPDGLVVRCGEGAVAFSELQLAGRRRLPAAAVLAGSPMAPGTRLG